MSEKKSQSWCVKKSQFWCAKKKLAKKKITFLVTQDPESSQLRALHSQMHHLHLQKGRDSGEEGEPQKPECYYLLHPKAEMPSWEEWAPNSKGGWDM